MLNMNNNMQLSYPHHVRNRPSMTNVSKPMISEEQFSARENSGLIEPTEPQISSRVASDTQEGMICGPNSNRRSKRTSLAERMEQSDQLLAKSSLSNN